MYQSIDPCKAQEFKKLQEEGKQLAADGRLEESLQKFELAKKICPSDKVLKRIGKLKEILKLYEKEYSANASYQDMSNDSNSKKNCEIPPSTIHCMKNAFIPNVLNDIQNVQKSSEHMSTKSSDLDPKSESKFRELKKLAKQSAYDGKYEIALDYFRKAQSICDCPNVKKYIKEIQMVMSSNSSEVLKTENVSVKRKEQEPTSSPVHEMPCNHVEILETEDLTVKRKKEEPSSSVLEVVTEKSSITSLESDETNHEKKLEDVRLLYEEARELAAEGKLTNALQVLKKAQSIHETSKVQKRIDKLEELLAADSKDSDNNQMVTIAENFSVFHDIYSKLYPYQREGVAWMWKLYEMGKGGVLGDDMGLGKTFQVIAFISGMIDADLVKHVLIIMPVSLLKNWTKEFKKWCPGIIVQDFHSGSKKERQRNLLRVQKRGHVLLTSYGMVVNNVACMTEMDGEEFVWDYVILDEGHKIKNPTKTTKAVYEIPSKNRIVLTGTPIQNNLRELWSLYDFVHQGTLLGSLKTFKLQYENPITRAREKDATAGEKRLGTEMAENLKSLIKPYFLRRTKDEIWKKKTGDDDVEQLENGMEKMMISKLNAKKNDLILWTYMSDPQIEIYNSFLHSDAVKSILVSKRSPLVELTTLKKICDHPRLLSQRACLQLGLNGDIQGKDLEQELEDESTTASSIDNVSDESLLHESGKLKLVLQLLEHLKETGHRTLVFSLSRKILDMIHRILVNRNWKVMRLDGTVIKTEERERRIERFQKDASFPVFLLTTQVGGVGITLTAADRVIIYDPSWNPATDAQAVDRAYRIGQEKDVVVYRLITCGSVEEKIYRRQIFKDSITRQATGVTDPYRYFSKQELRELFSLDDAHYSATQVQLSEMHSSQRLTDKLLEKHIQYLKSLNIFGISDHDLMFSKSIQDSSEDNDKAAVSEDFIKKQVATAHELIKMEASVVAEGIRLARTYNRPYQEMVPLQKKSVRDTYKPPVLPEVIDLTENAVDMFPRERKSLESKSHDVAIKTHSLDILNRGQEQCSSSNVENFNISLPVVDREKASSISSQKERITIPPKNRVYDTEIKSDESPRFRLSYNIEKLRKSLDCPEPPPVLQDNVVHTLTDERNNSGMSAKDISHSVEGSSVHEDNESHSDVHSLLLGEQIILDELEPFRPISKLQDELKSNLIDLPCNGFKDFSFEPEVPQRYVKGSRRSCARKSFMISDSESSHRSSCESDLNATQNLVEDSEDAASEICDSSNSASVSFVPDSSSNTPDTVRLPKTTHIVSETPPTVFCFEPKSMSTNLSFKCDRSSLRKLEGSIRRITPLKVENNQTPQNSSFVQALATSVILTPYNSPEINENKHTSPESLVDGSSKNTLKKLSLDEDDSPLKFIKRKKPHQLCSDSEESDTDSENSDSSGNDLYESSRNSEHSDKAGEDNGHSDSENSDLSGNDLYESSQNSEHSNKAGEENGHSDSENSNASEDDHDDVEYLSSDESQSVFSGDGKEDSDFEIDDD